jgi:Tol biopolymer transport system component
VRVAGPGRFASCTVGGAQPASAYLLPTGVARICRGPDCKTGSQKRTGPTLRVDQSLRVGPFECTALANGVVCIVRQYRRGFFIGPDSVRRQEPTGYRDWNPVWSPDSRSIAFDRRRNDRRPFLVVTAVDRDGTNVRRVSPGQAHEAAWSPDGRRVAYLDLRRNGTPELWIMNSDRTGLRKLSGRLGNYAYRPVWSPDGRTIAVVSDGVIQAFDADNATLRRLNVGALSDGFAWSPDGVQVAFRSDQGCGICVMDISTGIPRSLFPDEGLHGGIGLSPDGRTVAFSSDRDGLQSANGARAGELYLANVDGTGVLKLTHPQDAVARDSNPIWSPDGRTILYEHESEYVSDIRPQCDPHSLCRPFTGFLKRELYAMDADGGNQRRFGPDRLQDLAWSPDSRTIAFTRDGRIWLMDADGSNPRRLT